MSAMTEPRPGDLRQLEERLRRRERELQAIRRITTALHGRTNVDELERQTLNVAIEVVGAQGGTIYVHEPSKRVLIFRYVVGATPEITRKLQGWEMPDSQGISGSVFQSQKGRVDVDVTKETRHNRGVDAQTQFVTTSMITVPITGIGGAPIGVLQVLNSQDRQFDEEDLELLEVIGAQAGSALENARLYEEARRASVVNLIGDISHDVKNLLTPVQTGTQTLEMMMTSMFEDLDGLRERLTDERREELAWAVDGVKDFYREAMEMVYDGVLDVQERVREIADAIKGIVAQPHFELTDFRERAEAVAKVLKLVAEKRGVTIDLSGVQEAGLIELDRKGIYNAVYNLINNAIPETPEGGMIMLRARAIDLDDGPGIEIQVADTGRGMPEHVRERMFTDNAVSTKPGGTGLGTRIVKNVIDAHHGTIRVDSELGKGTTFTVRLPARQPRGA